MVGIAVKSSTSTLTIAGEVLLICSSNLQLPHIDSDGTDLPDDFMTILSAHRGEYTVVHEISEGVTVVVGKSSS